MPQGSSYAKPQGEDTSGPVKYFTREKKKSEKDYRAANKRAYLEAVENSLKWAEQYARTTGRPPSRYAELSMRYQALLNEGKALPLTAGELEDQRSARESARIEKYRQAAELRNFDRDVAKEAKGFEVEEGRPRQKQTPHEKTQAQKAKRDAINSAIDQMKVDANTGALTSEIEGINKKEDKSLWDKVGGGIIKAAGGIAGPLVGNVGGEALKFINRGSQAALGAIDWGMEQNLFSDPLTSPGTATQNPENIPRDKWNKMTPEQKKMAKDNWAEAEKVLEEGPIYRARRGITGKETNYSITDNFMRQMEQASGYKPLTTAQRGAATVAGFGTEVVTDPTNLIGAGVVAKGAKGVKAVRQAARAPRVAEEVISGVKVAGHVADVAKQADVLRAPLELEQVSQSTRRAQQAAGAFEFGGEAQAASRGAELAEEATKARRINAATPAGLKELKTAAKKQARSVELARRLVKQGKIDGSELKGAEAVHADYLKRIADAEELQGVAKITPVGGKLSLLEKQYERLANLVAKNPENKVLRSKFTEKGKALEAARVAAIPENANLVMRAMEKAVTGKKPTAAEVKAVVDAPASLQDQLIAAAKASEAMPGKANVVDEVIGGGKKATKITGDAADLPSSRYIAAINKAAEEATITAASKETLSDAAKLAMDEAADKRIVRIGEDLLNEAKTANRKLSPGTIKSRVAQQLQELAGSDEVLEAAARSTNRKIGAIRSTGEKLIPSTRKLALLQESILEEVLPMGERLEQILLEGSGKRFAIRFAGKDLGEFAPIGTALTKAYAPFELIGRKTGGRGFSKMFRMGAHFEGETNYIRQMAENSGTVAHKTFVKKIQQAFAGMTRDEAKLVTKAVEGGYEISDPKLEAWRQAAIQLSDEIFAEQTKIGKYIPTEKVKNFVYHYYHSRNVDAITDLKKGRKADLRSGIKGPTIETAAQKGLKPETDIDKILTMQHRDHVRTLQRANFRQMIISHFGVLTDNGAFANGLGLQEVSPKKLNKMFADKAAASGKTTKWYLPPEIHKTFKAMDDLMNIGFNKEADQFMGALDTVVRGYKTTATVGNLGNWVNNTVGDFFLNWIDGVKSPMWYKKATSVMRATTGARKKTLGVAGHSVDANWLIGKFDEKAPTGGFLATEGIGPVSRKAGRPLRYVGRKISGGYETRERWVRFAHFLHATDDEARNLIRAGKGKTFDDVKELATELAAKRVSKWNIDYTELTPFERQLRKRYVPFYTFVRKATPLMLEAMITRPGKINHYNMAQRSLERFLGVPPMEDDGTIWPDWTKEQGITRLTNEDEPLYIRDPSPLNVINRLTGGNNLNDPLSNVLNMTSPLLKMPIEAGQRRTLYNDSPITDWGAWWWNQLPPASIISRLRGQPLSPQKPIGEEGKAQKAKGTPWLERLSVAGVPFGRNTEQRQQAELHRQEGKNSSTQVLKRINEGISPYEIKSGGSSTGKHGKYYNVFGPDGEIISRHRKLADAVLATQDRASASA